MEPLFLWDEMIKFLFLGPDDQLLHVRPKPTKAETNEAQGDRAQSSGGCRQIRPTVPNQSFFSMCQSNNQLPTDTFQTIQSQFLLDAPVQRAPGGVEKGQNRFQRPI